MDDDPKPLVIASMAMALLMAAVFFMPKEKAALPSADREVLRDSLAAAFVKPAMITTETDPMRLARSGKMTVRITAKVLDNKGALLPGQKVNFKVTSGPGALDALGESTDVVGQAQAMFVPWKLDTDEITVVRACVNGSALCSFAAIDPTEY